MTKIAADTFNEILLLSPGCSTSKVKHPETFETLKAFEPCVLYEGEIFTYQSVHELVEEISQRQEWMPVLGKPTPRAIKAIEAGTKIPRRKKQDPNDPRKWASISDEVDSNLLILELDKIVWSDFDINNPSDAVERFCRGKGIDCHVTWQLSASQKPEGKMVSIHVYLELDRPYSLTERKALAMSLGSDGSIYNGVNPCYMAPPEFRTSLDGPLLEDPIPRRIGFITGSGRFHRMPDPQSINVALKQQKKTVRRDSKTGAIKSIGYTSVKVAEEDIRNGINYHDAMLFLSCSMANQKGISAKEIKERITSLMECVPEKDDRWFDRMDDRHLDDICNSAIEFVRSNPCDKPLIVGGATITCMAGLEPEDVEWDVYGFLIKSRLNLLAGDRGAGKSSLCSWIVSQYTLGGSWGPIEMPLANVAWLSCEERPEAEILTRFLVNGGDANRFFTIGSLLEQGSFKSFWDFMASGNIDQLKSLLIQKKISALVIDPILGFAGDANTMSPTEMRRLMTNINDLAVETDCTIIALMHVNKKSSGRILDDITGSVQITAAVRNSLGLARDPDTGLVYVSSVKHSFTDGHTSIFETKFVKYNEESQNTWAKVRLVSHESSESADDVANRSFKARQAALLPGKKLKAPVSLVQMAICEALVQHKVLGAVQLREHANKVAVKAGYREVADNHWKECLSDLKGANQNPEAEGFAAADSDPTYIYYKSGPDKSQGRNTYHVTPLTENKLRELKASQASGISLFK